MTNDKTVSRSQLATALQVLNEFRKIDPEMPIQVATVFLEVANNNGAIAMTDLGERVGIAQSSVSRNVAALGKVNRFHQPGHDLLEAKEDPMERRRKLVDLTMKGKRVVQTIVEVINKSRR